eukprot:TRINITY_DN29868_c0_g1_i1.p1 TRINITY_DN29868_c0_g1~~TRINITY_DN29868_c0_g1_i1.p1  ORF type:complete len:383 (+),score=135.06 TRINITY_DN29868_c0_g1_i1:57-1151(+)
MPAPSRLPSLLTSGVVPPECTATRVDVRGCRPPRRLKTAAGNAVMVGRGADGLPYHVLGGLERGHEIGLQQLYEAGPCADVQLVFIGVGEVPACAVHCVAEKLQMRCPQLLRMITEPPHESYFRPPSPPPPRYGGCMRRRTSAILAADGAPECAARVLPEPMPELRVVRHMREFADPRVFEVLFRYASFGADDCVAPPTRPVPDPMLAADVMVAATHFGVSHLVILAEHWAEVGLGCPAVSDSTTALGRTAAGRLLIHLRTLHLRHPSDAVRGSEAAAQRLRGVAHAALQAVGIPRLPLRAPDHVPSVQERVQELEKAGLLEHAAALPQEHLLRLQPIGALSDTRVKAAVRRALASVPRRRTAT